MKKILLGFILVLFCQFVNGQTYTQTYVDKCSGEIKVATTTYTNGYATVSFYNQVKTFTPLEVQSGAVQIWLNATYAAYSTMACPTNQVVQQTVTQAVSQATSQAASAAASAASSAASSAAAAASSSASSAASSSASAAASSSASAASSSASSSASSASSSAASSGASASAGTSQSGGNSSTGTSQSGGSSSSSGSSSSGGSSSSSESKSSGGSSSSEQKSEQKTEQKSEQKQEQKQEEKKEETKSESKEEKKEESKSEEKKEEKKEESKKEEKKDEKKENKKEDKKKNKVQVGNPMIMASDLAGTQSADKSVSMMLSLGISKSSMMGDKSYSATALVWSTLDQFALSGGVTKMDFDEGKLNAIHSYSATFAYLKGTMMAMQGYTYIKPHPKYGTYGFNAGLIHLVMRNAQNTGYEYSLMTSVVGFWTKPYQVNRKTTISPQVFVMNAPISYNTITTNTMVNRSPGFILGSGYDYKISRRFAFGASYKAVIAIQPQFSLLHNIQIGSKLSF